jgi:fluoroacetyl-CoA thioesterase
MTTLKEKLSGKDLTLQWDIGKDDIFDGFLSTAALTRFMLNTSWRLVAAELTEGVTSVTALVQVSHEEPTPAGETVTIDAHVTEVNGNIVRITFKAVDETGVIAHGYNERHVVDRTNLEKLAAKRAAVLHKIT